MSRISSRALLDTSLESCDRSIVSISAGRPAFRVVINSSALGASAPRRRRCRLRAGTAQRSFRRERARRHAPPVPAGRGHRGAGEKPRAPPCQTFISAFCQHHFIPVASSIPAPFGSGSEIFRYRLPTSPELAEAAPSGLLDVWRPVKRWDSWEKVSAAGDFRSISAIMRPAVGGIAEEDAIERNDRCGSISSDAQNSSGAISGRLGTPTWLSTRCGALSFAQLLQGIEQVLRVSEACQVRGGGA